MISRPPSIANQLAVPRRGQPAKKPNSEIVELAKNRLEANDQFHGRSQAIRMKEHHGTLVLEGQVPSFYLKQILQTILKNIDGVEAIENRVGVFLPTRSEVPSR